MSQQYDPDKQHRRSIRWKNWDYGKPAYYFITICTNSRMPLFDNQQFLEIANQAWQRLPELPKSWHIRLDEWVVMPDHVHGLMEMWQRLGGVEPVEITNPRTFDNVASGQLGRVVATYKSSVTTRINAIRSTRGAKVWQRGYWDRVILDNAALQRVRLYIRENPQRWAENRDNLDTLLERMHYHP